jgi:hypothetical protein
MTEIEKELHYLMLNNQLVIMKRLKAVCLYSSSNSDELDQQIKLTKQHIKLYFPKPDGD